MSGYPLPRWLILILPVSLVILGLAGFALTQKTVTLHDGGSTVTFNTGAGTVGEAVSAAGIALQPEDILQPGADEPLGSGQTITLIRTQAVQIVDSGQTTTIHTHQKKLSAILLEAGRTLAPDDSVYVDGKRLAPDADAFNTAGAVPHTVVIQRARPITILDNSIQQTLITSALTVGEALAEADIATYLADGVTPSLDSPLTPGLTVTITRALPVTIEVDGATMTTRTRRATVAEVLAEAGVAVVGLDIVAPSLADPPPADGSPIRVVRVVEQIATEQQPLAYTTQFQALPDLEIDNTRLVQAGTNGVTASRLRVRFENGIEVSRTVEDQWVAAQPQPRIIGYGTQIVLRSLDTAGGPVQYWRAVRMYATSYSAARAGTPRTAPWYGRTRSGKTLTIGMAAIDLNVMPLGTQLYVSGYGFVAAEDTGGGVKGKMIDLGYDDWNYVSWHDYVTVYFVGPVPPADQIKWILP
ncbi:MAG: DUF348 domain-containing protein [Chloroflexi bacterium]|nr:DUF348 domain-containing protein [Chloroflexota bacterium]